MPQAIKQKCVNYLNFKFVCDRLVVKIWAHSLPISISSSSLALQIRAHHQNVLAQTITGKGVDNLPPTHP